VIVPPSKVTAPTKVDIPDTFKLPPTFKLFSIPTPPSMTKDPLSFVVESVVLLTVVIPEISTSLLISTNVVLNVAIPVKTGLADPLAQDKFPLPSLDNTEVGTPFAAGK